MTYKINTVFPNTKNSETVYDNKMWKNTSCVKCLFTQWLSYEMKWPHTEQATIVATVLSATGWSLRHCTVVLNLKPTTFKEQ